MEQKRNWLVIIGLGVLVYWLYKKQVATITGGISPEEITTKTIELPWELLDYNKWQQNKQNLLQKYNLTLIQETEPLELSSLKFVDIIVKGRMIDITKFAKEVGGNIVDRPITELKGLIQKDGKFYCPYGGEELVPIYSSSPGAWIQVMTTKIANCPNGHGRIIVVVGDPGTGVMLVNPGEEEKIKEQMEELKKIFPNFSSFNI